MVGSFDQKDPNRAKCLIVMILTARSSSLFIPLRLTKKMLTLN
jgi:hypothetical protein